VDVEARGGLIACHKGIILGVLVPGLCGLAEELTRQPSVDWRLRPRSPLHHPGNAAESARASTRLRPTLVGWAM
jgi:hypothetical protein